MISKQDLHLSLQSLNMSMFVRFESSPLLPLRLAGASAPASCSRHQLK